MSHTAHPYAMAPARQAQRTTVYPTIRVSARPPKLGYIGHGSRTYPREFSHTSAKAQEVYKVAEVEGFPEKDIVAADHFQAMGAEFDARPEVVASGLVSLAAPTSRRIPLALLSLQAASLPVTSGKRCCRLADAWVAAALFQGLVLWGFTAGFWRKPSEGIDLQVTRPQSRALALSLPHPVLLT